LRVGTGRLPKTSSIQLSQTAFEHHFLLSDEEDSPLYLLLLGPWLLKERVRASDLMLMAVLATGMSLFFVGEQRPLVTATDPFLGNVLAAVSGFTWAVVIAGMRWLERTEQGHQAGLSATVSGNAIAALACFPLAMPVTGAESAVGAARAGRAAEQTGAARRGADSRRRRGRGPAKRLMAANRTSLAFPTVCIAVVPPSTIVPGAPIG